MVEVFAKDCDGRLRGHSHDTDLNDANWHALMFDLFGEVSDEELSSMPLGLPATAMQSVRGATIQNHSPSCAEWMCNVCNRINAAIFQQCRACNSERCFAMVPEATGEFDTGNATSSRSDTDTNDDESWRQVIMEETKRDEMADEVKSIPLVNLTILLHWIADLNI